MVRFRFGDSPDVRKHPALKGVALPDKLGVSGSPGAMVTKGGLVFATGGGRVLYAWTRATAARSGSTTSDRSATRTR